MVVKACPFGLVIIKGVGFASTDAVGERCTLPASVKDDRVDREIMDVRPVLCELGGIGAVRATGVEAEAEVLVWMNGGVLVLHRGGQLTGRLNESGPPSSVLSSLVYV